MTAQRANVGGRFLSQARSQLTPRAMSEDARDSRTTHPATAPLVEFLSRKSVRELMRWMALKGIGLVVDAPNSWRLEKVA